MKRKTVNICFQKCNNEYYLFLGNHPYAFGRIYDIVFFDILNDEQKAYMEANKLSRNFIVNKLKLSNNQYIDVIEKTLPLFRQFSFYEQAFIKAQKLKQHENNTINP